MSLFNRAVRWLQRRVYPGFWLWAHECDLARDWTCKNPRCPLGKDDDPRWFKMDGIWHRTKFYSDTPWANRAAAVEAQRKPVKPQILYRYKDGYTSNRRLVDRLNHRQVNGMLQEAHRRIQR